MSGESLAARVLAAAQVLEELQAAPVTNCESYSPQQLRNIVAMYSGGRER